MRDLRSAGSGKGIPGPDPGAHAEGAHCLTIDAKLLSRRGRGQGLAVAHGPYRITIDPLPRSAPGFRAVRAGSVPPAHARSGRPA